MSQQPQKPKNGLQLLLVIAASVSVLLGVIASLRPTFLASEVVLCLVIANLAGLLSWRCRKDASVPVKSSERYLIAFVVLIFLGQILANSDIGKGLMYKAIRQNDVSILHIWLTLGTPRDSIVLGESSTPLNAALLEGDLDTARLLLEAGADPNRKDHSQWTPLQVARMNHNQSAVVLLLKYGAKDAFPAWSSQPGTRTFTEYHANYLDLRQEPDANP